MSKATYFPFQIFFMQKKVISFSDLWLINKSCNVIGQEELVGLKLLGSTFHATVGYGKHWSKHFPI